MSTSIRLLLLAHILILGAAGFLFFASLTQGRYGSMTISVVAICISAFAIREGFKHWKDEA